MVVGNTNSTSVALVTTSVALVTTSFLLLGQQELRISDIMSRSMESEGHDTQ